MDRRSFVQLTAGAVSLTAIPMPALAGFSAGKMTTLQTLFNALPRPRPGEWVRIIMGAGVAYQKQIGLGAEAEENGDRYFVETQIGMPGGACNPNTMKRVYLEQSHFGSLMSQELVLANVANSGTILTRWGDRGDGQTQTPGDAHLRLVDEAYLYDDRPLRIVSTASETVHVPESRGYRGSEDAARPVLHPAVTTHVVADFAPPYNAKHKLTRIELWSTPALPYGVAKYRATASHRDPFEMQLYSHGIGFKSDLNMSLGTIRAITPDGTHIQTG